MWETWEGLYNILPYFSMFLVMLLTVTRTIAIIQPFRKIKTANIYYLIAGYGIFLIANIPLKKHFETTWYVKEFGYCLSTSKLDGQAYQIIQNLLLILQVALPSVIIFMSFCVSVNRLLRRPNPQMGAWKVRQRVSVTIAMFTGLFLFWNFPFFINIFLILIIQISPNMDYPEPYFTSEFMGSYSWIISKVLFVVMNATCNPVLYMCRMKGFARWIGLIDADAEEGKVKNNFKYLMPMTQALTFNPAITNVRAASRRFLSIKKSRKHHG